jgi:glycosyltransferase involved in cell wall biosynthesis
MKIGINEVLIYDRASGTQQRELNSLPELLRQMKACSYTGTVYVARDLSDEIASRLTGQSKYPNVVRTPIPAIPTYKRVLRGLFYWRNQVIKDRLDLFHTSYYPVPKLPIPTVLTVNDLRFIHLPDTYRRCRRAFLQLMVRPSLHRATRIIAISQNTKNDIINYFNVVEDKIDVIHIPVGQQYKKVTDLTALEGIRRRYFLPERFILYVGHLEPRKNLYRLLLAFDQMYRTQGIVQKLVILGKPEFGFESLLAMVNERGLKTQVCFTGYVDEQDMPAIYTLADLLIFPSLHEGFGMPIIEAMACETPVVTSNLSAMPEVAGNAAILVDPYSVEDIVLGMLSLLKNEELCRDLIAEGLKRVKRFNSQETATAILRTYQRALDKLP